MLQTQKPLKTHSTFIERTFKTKRNTHKQWIPKLIMCLSNASSIAGNFQIIRNIYSIRYVLQICISCGIINIGWICQYKEFDREIYKLYKQNSTNSLKCKAMLWIRNIYSVKYVFANMYMMCHAKNSWFHDPFIYNQMHGLHWSHHVTMSCHNFRRIIIIKPKFMQNNPSNTHTQDIFA